MVKESSPSISYTRDLSLNPKRLNIRTNPNILTSSAFVDKIQGCLSIFTGISLLFILTLAQSFIMPFIIGSKILNACKALRKIFFSGKRGFGNVSTTSGSLSAIKVLMSRTTANSIGIGPDFLAPKLMGFLSMYGYGVPGSRYVTKLYLILYRWNFALTSRLFGDQVIESFTSVPFGEISYIQARTCWLDDAVETFLLEHKDKKINLIILGAGYDTRCYRLLTNNAACSCFEVDTAATQHHKMKALIESGIAKDKQQTIAYVSCDFTSQNWVKRCIEAGLNQSIPTFIVWEGVCMYLPKEVALQTIKDVGTHFAEGSCIAFDYIDSTWFQNTTYQKLTKIVGEQYLFGMKGSEPEEIIERINETSPSLIKLKILDHVNGTEATKRYLPKHSSDGRSIGLLGNFGGYMVVGKNSSS